ncbi:MAG: hypothetical protein IAA73_09915 [Bacteroidetes bacterium]|uniref:Uncharacterized protein n=1 Tax=Candidatus Gallipaludibacter merdavium TaxID=2840839 RepID=A0A9D9HVP9_9BACT|nr:hypothetical protein [Candidatus Gallipaludibacter merdavium]
MIATEFNKRSRYLLIVHDLMSVWLYWEFCVSATTSSVFWSALGQLNPEGITWDLGTGFIFFVLFVFARLSYFPKEVRWAQLSWIIAIIVVAAVGPVLVWGAITQGWFAVGSNEWYKANNSLGELSSLLFAMYLIYVYFRLRKYKREGEDGVRTRPSLNYNLLLLLVVFVLSFRMLEVVSYFSILDELNENPEAREFLLKMGQM